MIIKIIKKHYNLSVFVLFIFFIFLVNLSIQYSKYQELVDEEVFETKVEVINIYKKDKFDVLKLRNNDFTFFTNFEKNQNVNKLDVLNLAFITTKVTFYDYLKGFYTKTIYFEKVPFKTTFTKTLINKSDSQHHNEMIKELFQALFFAVPISQKLREVCTNYGISHLIALSGFHLATLSFLIYWICYLPYGFFHRKYFPYRNIKFDLLLVTLIFLFFYVLLTNIVPSLFRAFIMMCFGILLLRYNIQLFSFLNLFLVFLVIIALFPKYIFSLSLWFSILGVFYIFLYIHYFKDIKNWLVHIILFNFWIYFAMNPIVHYFFDVVTIQQLISPFLTMAFSIFYPIELFLHLIDYSGVFDSFLIWFFSVEFTVFNVSTPMWFFILYLMVSLFSIYSKQCFILLNILLILFSTYLHSFTFSVHQYF